MLRSVPLVRSAWHARDDADDVFGEPVLKVEDVIERTIEAIGQM
jgi:hypothetical protein